MPRLPFKRQANTALQRDHVRAVVLVLILDALALGSTALLAAWRGVRFSVWLEQTDLFMLAAFAYMVSLGLLWDFALIVGSRVPELLERFGAIQRRSRRRVSAWRERGFFALGPGPLLIVLVTTHAVIGTSNITLISLDLLSSVTAWRDSLLWAIEGAAHETITQLPIDVPMWEGLYHSAWSIELFALFVLIVLARRSDVLLHFCFSFVLLFYLGRFIGLINPVMGPAFFQPEVYAYLEGSLSASLMQKIAITMATDVSEVSLSAALLGGVSAMPSLHVGMVSLTVYWLAVTNQKTLFVGIPWLLAVWSSTVVLGWHYVLDGAGGIGLAIISVQCTRMALRKLQQGMPAAEPLMLGFPSTGPARH